ncbi:MAG: MFS transporter [Dehalococcoidia bacterium]
MIQQFSLNSATGRWVMLATILASGTAFLMGTAVMVALPAIQSHYGTGMTGIQWVVNANLLSLAALLLIGGSLGDRFGRKRIFMAGIALFAAGAILAGLSGTIGSLIAFQAVQGAGAALMIPQSLAIISACFAENERGRAIGLWAGFAGGVAALGPWVGGWVVETFSWQGVFFLTAPLSVLALIVTSVFVPESRNPDARRLDWRGTALIFLGLLGTAYGLIAGPAVGWSHPLVVAGLIGGPAAIILFILVELRLPEPLVPLRIFRNPLIAGANTVTFFLYFALNGVILFLVLNLQQVQGFSPAQAGLGLLPPIVIITFFAGPAGALADRIGPRLPMVLGPAIVASGMALLALGGTGADYFRQFMPGLVLFGMGMALVIAPLTKSALSVEPQFSGAASGVNNALSRIAALMAVAVLGAVVISAFTARLEDTIGATNLSGEQRIEILSQSGKLGGIVIPETFDPSARKQAGDAVRKSFIHGFRRAMGVCAALALAGAVVSYLTIHPQAPRRPDRPPP